MPDRLKNRKALGICAIFQDEASYLGEWIEFHRLQGVEHFFLYDNRSHDEPERVLRPWLDEGVVTLLDWPWSFEDYAQVKAYNHCLEHFGTQFEWMAMLDIDEFLFCPDGDPLPDILATFTGAPAVVANWQVYGSSGHEKSPGGLVIEQFTRRAQKQWVRNRRIKSIVRPERTEAFRSPHMAVYRNGDLAVSENGEPCKVYLRNRAEGRWIPHYWQRFVNALGKRLFRLFPDIPLDPFCMTPTSLRQVSVERLRINHYAVKSVEDFARRKARRRIPGHRGSGTRVHNDLRFAFQDRNGVHDPVLVKWAPELRRRLSLKS
jgi:hypothetical protein